MNELQLKTDKQLQDYLAAWKNADANLVDISTIGKTIKEIEDEIDRRKN